MTNSPRDPAPVAGTVMTSRQVRCQFTTISSPISVTRNFSIHQALRAVSS